MAPTSSLCHIIPEPVCTTNKNINTPTDKLNYFVLLFWQTSNHNSFNLHTSCDSLDLSFRVLKAVFGVNLLGLMNNNNRILSVFFSIWWQSYSVHDKTLEQVNQGPKSIMLKNKLMLTLQHWLPSVKGN